MLFPDFETGDLLTLTGTVEILWGSEETEFFEGAERLWQFKIDHGYWMKKALISIARLALLEAIPTRSIRKLTMINAAHGLLPEYSCRSGQCSNCKVKLISGNVSYNQPLHTSVNGDEVLLCCAMPAEASGDDMIKVEIDL